MIRWQHEQREARTSVEEWLAGAPIEQQVLRDNPRRRLVRLDPGGGAAPLLVKHFRSGSGRHRRREAWKARLGRSPATREAQHLIALAGLGVAVPRVLGLGVLDDGDRLLVLPFLSGRSLAEVLADPLAPRAAALTALGRTLAALHAAGFVHGDLHRENLIFVGDTPKLLDLQHARRTRSPAARLQDLGDLDYSLWDRASLADRLRLRKAATASDASSPREALRPADQREALRAVGHAARRRADAHGRSRTRRAMRPGRRFAALDLPKRRGLRLREIDDATVGAALEAHGDALTRGSGVLKDDGRSRITRVSLDGRDLVVKQVVSRGAGRTPPSPWPSWNAATPAWRSNPGCCSRPWTPRMP
jgi:tRNA A-37 threonylcarbamoyl transferase component Bud32